MRSAPLLLSLSVSVLVAAAALLLFGGESPTSPDDPSRAPDAATPSDDAAPATSTPSASATASLPAGTIARHALPPTDPGKPLADAPTACLQIVDHATERPVGGAVVRRVHGGIVVAFSDERGLVPLPLREMEQLAVAADGYLLRLAPTHLGTSEREPQPIRLVADRWSLRRRLEFTAPDATPIGDVFVRIRPAAQPSPGAMPPPARSPVTDPDPVVQRAWTEHTVLVGLLAAHDVTYVGINDAEQRAYRLQHGGEVHFVMPGSFRVEAATLSGLVGAATVTVDARDAPPVAIQLQPGAFVEGQVIGLRTARGLGGAEITLQGGDPLALVATTAPDGAFRLGPLAAGPVTLHVRHPDHEPLAYGPVNTPTNTLRLPLQELPQTTLRGMVRSRPDLRPVGNAAVQWLPQGGGAAVTTTSRPDGTFVLAANGHGSGRLSVTAVGYLPFVELVEVGAPFAHYDLWPGERDARVEAGISAVLAGVVVAGDVPQPGVKVTWSPAQTSPRPEFTARRVLEGAALTLPRFAVTGADGSFQLETTDFGRGELGVADGGTALPVEAIAGKTIHGLRLQR